MALPTELLVPDEEPPVDPHLGFRGKFDIAALLEEHLQLLPEGLDPEGDPALLDHLFESARAQSEPGLNARLRPCRDPTKDHLLEALHAAETRHPRAYGVLLCGLLICSCVLFGGTLGLNAVVVWVLWTYGSFSLLITSLVLLLLHLPLTALTLALQLGNHHRFTAWVAIPLYDMACLLALPVLQLRPLAGCRRLVRRFPRAPEAELWLWQYRACRQLLLAVLHSLPMAILDVVACADLEVVRHHHKSHGGWRGGGGGGGALPAHAVGALLTAAVVSALHAAQALAEATLNARWSGQMPLLSYVVLALQLRGSRKLDYDWQVLLAEQRIVIKPDSPDFFELTRPQQCQVLRLVLQRPHFTISNVVTHPRPPPKPARDAAGSRRTSTAEGSNKEARAGGGGGDGAVEGRGCGRSAAAVAVVAAWRRMEAVVVAWCGRLPAFGPWLIARAVRRRRRRNARASDSDEESGARPQAPPSACLLLQSKAAVKSVVGLLPGPLAAAHRSLVAGGEGEFSVNLVSFQDAASCKHCGTLLELVMRQGLRSLVICDAKLPLDFFAVFTSYLPSPNCQLTKLVLKDVMSSGISTLCMLATGLASNSSVTHLDMSNNQLWGVRGAKELRAMLRGNGGLRVLLLPFCNIASLGAVEIFKGAAECPTLERLDLSQNHIGDDTPDWADVPQLRNSALREVDLSFNWIQDSLAGWAAGLLEAFPTLTRLHLNHNSDAASSRVASRAATPRITTPRTLTPRTLTPSNLRIASYSQSILATAAAAAAAAAGGAAAGVGGSAGTAAPPNGAGAAGATSAGVSPLQPMPSSSIALSPSGSGRLEAAVGQQAVAVSPPLASAPPSPLQLQPLQSSALVSQGPHGGATRELPGRSRGQHLLAHLEMYQLAHISPLRKASTRQGGPSGPLALAAAPVSLAAAGRDVGRRSLSRDSQAPVHRCGNSLPSLALLRTQPSAGAASRAALLPPGGSRRLSGGVASQAPPPPPAAAPGGASGGAGASGAVNLWHAINGMERLDLRGVALPSWWARSEALRPASVLVDEQLVYDEPAPAGVVPSAGPALQSTGGGAYGGGGGIGSGGGGGGIGSDWLELPPHVVRALEAGLAQGLVVIDLNAPEYRSISRFQQLVAIYLALQHATHVTISNTSRTLNSGVHAQGQASGTAAAVSQGLTGGGAASGVFSGPGASLLQRQMSHGLGSGLALLRSSTSSFPRVNSGTAPFVNSGGNLGMGPGSGATNNGPGVGVGAGRLVSETGYLRGAAGGGGGGGGGGFGASAPSRISSSLAVARASANAVHGGVASMQRFGSFRGGAANGAGVAGGVASSVLSSPPQAVADVALGNCRKSAPPRRGQTGHDSSMNNLHRFALQRGGNSFTATTSAAAAAGSAGGAGTFSTARGDAGGAGGGGFPAGPALLRTSSSMHASASRGANSVRGFQKQCSLCNPVTGGPHQIPQHVHQQHHHLHQQHQQQQQALLQQVAAARRSLVSESVGAGTAAMVSAASGAVAEALGPLNDPRSRSCRHVELPGTTTGSMSSTAAVVASPAAGPAPGVGPTPAVIPGTQQSCHPSAAPSSSPPPSAATPASSLVTAGLRFAQPGDSQQAQPHPAHQQQLQQGDVAQQMTAHRKPAPADSTSQLEGLMVLGPGVSGPCSSGLGGAPRSGAEEEKEGRPALPAKQPDPLSLAWAHVAAAAGTGLPSIVAAGAVEAVEACGPDGTDRIDSGGVGSDGGGGGGGAHADSLGALQEASGITGTDLAGSSRFQATIARMLMEEDDTDPPSRTHTPGALVAGTATTVKEYGLSRTASGISTLEASNSVLASCGPSQGKSVPASSVPIGLVTASAAATAASAAAAVAEAISHSGSSSAGRYLLLPPPTAVQAHVLPAAGGRKRVDAPAVGTSGGNSLLHLGQAAMNMVAPNPRSSSSAAPITNTGGVMRRASGGGSGASSLVLAEDMPGEMWDAGVAFLRAASCEAPPAGSGAAPAGLPCAASAAHPAAAGSLPSSTAGPRGDSAAVRNPAATAAAQATADRPSSPVAIPGAGPVFVLPGSTAPLPVSPTPPVPCVGPPREGHPHSFSFIPCGRTSLDEHSRHSPATPAASSGAARPTSPLGPGGQPSCGHVLAGRPSRSQRAAGSPCIPCGAEGRDSLSSVESFGEGEPGQAAGGVDIPQPNVRHHKPAAPRPCSQASQPGRADGGGSGSGRGRETYGSGGDNASDNGEDLEVSFRVDAVRFGALRSFRDSSEGPGSPKSQVQLLQLQQQQQQRPSITEPEAAILSAGPAAAGGPNSGARQATPMAASASTTRSGPAGILPSGGSEAGAAGAQPLAETGYLATAAPSRDDEGGVVRRTQTDACDDGGKGAPGLTAGGGGPESRKRFRSEGAGGTRGGDHSAMGPVAEQQTPAGSYVDASGLRHPTAGLPSDRHLKAFGSAIATATVPSPASKVVTPVCEESGGGSGGCSGGPPGPRRSASLGPAPPSQADNAVSAALGAAPEQVVDVADGEGGAWQWQPRGPPTRIQAQPYARPVPSNLRGQHHHHRHHSASPATAPDGMYHQHNHQTGPAAFNTAIATTITSGTSPPYGSNVLATGSQLFGTATTAAAAAGAGGLRASGGFTVAAMFDRPRSAFVAEPPSDTTNEMASAVDPVEPFVTEGGPDLLMDSNGIVSAVGTMRSTMRIAGRFSTAAAAAAASGGGGGGGGGGGLGLIGVEASSAVSVVIVLGYDGQLRLPLRCLELPLRGAMARRPGLTVSFKLAGLSHDGMRQLRALMGVAKVPMPERSYAWLLPSHSQHLPSTTNTGLLPPNGGSQALPPYQSLGPSPGMAMTSSGYSSFAAAPTATNGGCGGGPGSRAVSRVDSGGTRDFYGYSHLPSYYLDTRGQPVDLGFILPPPTDSAEPSGCLSAAYSTTPVTHLPPQGPIPGPQGLASGAGGGAGGVATHATNGSCVPGLQQPPATAMLQPVTAGQDELQLQQQDLTLLSPPQQASMLPTQLRLPGGGRVARGVGGGAAWDEPVPPGVPTHASEQGDRDPGTEPLGTRESGQQPVGTPRTDDQAAAAACTKLSSGRLPRTSLTPATAAFAASPNDRTNTSTSIGVADNPVFLKGGSVFSDVQHDHGAASASAGRGDLGNSAPYQRQYMSGSGAGGGAGSSFGQSLNLPQGVMLVNLQLRGRGRGGAGQNGGGGARSVRTGVAATDDGSLSGDVGSEPVIDSGLSAGGGGGGAGGGGWSSQPDDDCPQFTGTLEESDRTLLQVSRSGVAGGGGIPDAGDGGANAKLCSGCGGLARASFSAFGRLSAGTSSGAGDSTATGTPLASFPFLGGAGVLPSSPSGNGLPASSRSGAVARTSNPTGADSSAALSPLGAPGSSAAALGYAHAQVAFSPQGPLPLFSTSDAYGSYMPAEILGNQRPNSRVQVGAFGSAIDVTCSNQHIATEMLASAGLPSGGGGLGGDGASGHLGSPRGQGSLLSSIGSVLSPGALLPHATSRSQAQVNWQAELMIRTGSSQLPAEAGSYALPLEQQGLQGPPLLQAHSGPAQQHQQMGYAGAAVHGASRSNGSSGEARGVESVVHQSVAAGSGGSGSRALRTSVLQLSGHGGPHQQQQQQPQQQQQAQAASRMEVIPEGRAFPRAESVKAPSGLVPGDKGTDESGPLLRLGAAGGHASGNSTSLN